MAHLQQVNKLNCKFISQSMHSLHSLCRIVDYTKIKIENDNDECFDRLENRLMHRGRNCIRYRRSNMDICNNHMIIWNN